jgi:hypothetical protein
MRASANGQKQRQITLRIPSEDGNCISILAFIDE